MITRDQAKAELAKLGIHNKKELDAYLQGDKKKEETEEREHWLTGSWENKKRNMAQGFRNVAKGAGSLLDLPPFLLEAAAYPMELIKYGVHKGVHKIAPKHFSSPKFPEFGTIQTEIGPGIAATIDNWTKGYTAPQTPGERVAEGVTEALTTIPVIGTTAKAAQSLRLPQLAKTLAPLGEVSTGNIGATAGGEGAIRFSHEVNKNPSLGEDFIVGSAGSAAGGLGAALALKGAKGLRHVKHPIEGAKNAWARQVGKTMKFSPELHKQAKKLGIEPTLGAVSKDPSATYVELLLSKNPKSGHRMQASFKQQERALAKHLGVQEPDFAKVIENPRHELAREGAQKYKEAKSKFYETTINPYKDLEKRLLTEKRLRIPADDVVETLKGKYALGAYTPSEVKHFENTLPGKTVKGIETSIKEGKELSSHSNRVKKAQADIEQFRHDARKISIPEPMIEHQIKEAFPEELKLIESAVENPQAAPTLKTLQNLKEDALAHAQKTVVVKEREAANTTHDLLRDKIIEGVDPFATPAEKEARNVANKVWADYVSPNQSNMQNYVEKLVRLDDDSKAFERLVRHPKYLIAASHYLPKEDKSSLLEALMATYGKNRAQGRFNIANVQTAFHHWNPKVKEGVKNLLPTDKARENFEEAMHWIGQNKERINSVANTSGTAHMTEVYKRWKEYPKVAIKIGHAALTGKGLVEPLKELSTQAVLEAAAKVGSDSWTDPKFLERINKAIKAKNRAGIVNHTDLFFKLPEIRQMVIGATTPTSKQDYIDNNQSMTSEGARAELAKLGIHNKEQLAQYLEKHTP